MLINIKKTIERSYYPFDSVIKPNSFFLRDLRASVVKNQGSPLRSLCLRGEK